MQWANHTQSQGLCYFIFAQRWVLDGESTKLSHQVENIRTLFICSACLIYSVFSIWLFLSCAELASYLGWPCGHQYLQFCYCHAGFLNFFLSWVSCSSRFFLTIFVTPLGLWHLKWVRPWNLIRQHCWQKICLRHHKEGTERRLQGRRQKL